MQVRPFVPSFLKNGFRVGIGPICENVASWPLESFVVMMVGVDTVELDTVLVSSRIRGEEQPAANNIMVAAETSSHFAGFGLALMDNDLQCTAAPVSEVAISNPAPPSPERADTPP